MSAGRHHETHLAVACSGDRLARSRRSIGPRDDFMSGRWEMHPMWWWGWGIGMMAMMFLFWALVIVGAAYGVRRGHKWKRHLGMDRLLSRDWRMILRTRTT